jgi:ribose 5-phosphate isomerase B
MIDGAGIGSSMAANKLKGIRAALCYDLKTILNSRQHNDANVLTLGASANPPEVVEEMVATWLATPFEGGRHQKRVDKIE